MEIAIYFLVIFICYLTGKHYADKEKERAEFFTELLSFLEFFYKGVSEHKNTQTIFSEYSKNKKNKIICAKNKDELVSFLKGKNYKNDNGTVEAVTAFFVSFGKSDSFNAEIKACFEILERTKHFCEDSIQYSYKKNEMYKKLGIIFGITICIIIM